MRVRVPLGEAGGSSPSTLFPPPPGPIWRHRAQGGFPFPHLATETRLPGRSGTYLSAADTLGPGARRGFMLRGARSCGHWLEKLGVGHLNWFEEMGAFLISFLQSFFFFFLP